YLWHWPVFALTRPDLDLELGGVRLFALRAALTFITSELCYCLIERPIRGGALSRLRARPLAFGASATSLALLTAGLVSLSGTRLASASKTANAAWTPTAAPPPVARLPDSSDDPQAVADLKLVTGTPLD